jgi:hypothetical protein
MKDNLKKIAKTETNTIIDAKTGEIIATEQTTISYGEKEPAYVKLYVDDVVRLVGLPPSTTTVLMEIIGNIGYQNIFAAYAPVKRMICKTLDININTLNKAIQNLYQKGILLRVERGVYIVDPNLFARGKWEDIKTLRLTIEYDAKTNKRVLKSNAKEQFEQLSLFPK